MTIEIIENNQERYESYLKDFGGNFQQSWLWGEWQKKLGKRVARFLISENEKVISAGQVIYNSITFGKNYTYCAYGPVFLPETTTETKNKILNLIQTELANNETIFFRAEPHESYKILGQKVRNSQPARTLVVNLSKSNEELFAGMHPKTRYNIRLSEKHGVIIKKDFEIDNGKGVWLTESLNLIAQTAVRQAYRDHSQSYYNNLLDFFMIHNRADVKFGLFRALYQNEILSCAIVCDYGDTRVYLYGGSSEEHRSVMAPYALHWQIINDAKEKGLKVYDFGGLETSRAKTPGFTRFKQGFGGSELVFSGAHDLIIKPVWYNIYRIARQINLLSLKLWHRS